MKKLFTVLFVLLFSIAFFCSSFAQNNKISNNGYADLKAPPFMQPRDPGIVNIDNRLISQDQKSNQNPIITNQQGMMPNAVVTIGTGTSVSTSYDITPYKTYWMDGQDQILFTAAELSAAGLGAGNITAFAFNVAVADAYTLNQFTISAQHTALTALSGFITTGWTQCYTGNVAAVAGWNTYTFSTNFNWNGTSNIVFKVCYNNAGYTNQSSVYYSTTPATGVHYYWYGDLSTTSGCDQITATSTTYRPNVRITGAAGVSPVLTVNPSSLAFGYVPVGGTSAVKADTLRGTNLTGFPSNIVVTAPAGFEVCLTLGGTYTSSVNVPYTSSTLAATTIYSRFKPTILQNYSGNITNAGGGATTVNVAVTGSAYLYAGYCTSSASTVDDEDIFNVTLGTLNNSSTCATTGGIGSILNRYSNYTTTVTAPNIQAGGSIPFSVTSGTCGGNYGNAFKIFIDFNQNSSFLDAGEEVYVSTIATTGPHTETGNVSVPAGATLGNTMMRVVCVETSTPSSITSCGSYSWGETEDYIINITPPPANDVGTFSIDISDVNYPGSFTPKATVKNFGSATQTFPVTMVINPGGYTSTQTVTSLASGLTQQVSFAGFTGAVGSYNVTVYTQLNPDANMTNDTLRKAINFSNGLWISGTAATIGTYLGTGVGYTRNDSGWVFSIGGNSTLGTEVIKYNVLANTYATMTSLPAKRVVGSSALLKDSIYVIGGSTDGSNYLNTVVKYDINANTWSTLTSTLPALLGWSKSAGYQDSLIYTAGGIVGGVPVNTVYVYNVNTNTWRSATSLPAARFGGAFAISGDTLVYVGGADAALLYATTYRGVISQSDRSVITWTTGTDYPGGARYRFDAAPMGTDKGIMVAGGSPSTAWTAVNDAYSYSPGLNQWTRKFNKTTPVLGASVGSVYIGNNNWRYAVVSGYTGTVASTVTELYADTILTKPSFAPTLLSPPISATLISVTPTLDWTDVGNTSNYGVQVSTENTFTTGIVINTSGLASSQYVVPASILSYSTHYYWRARANNGAGSSSWSAIWDFTTIYPAPAAPTLLTPANNSVDLTVTPTLDWNDVSTAVSYRVQISTSNTFGTTVYDTVALTLSQITVPSGKLTTNTMYYWRVNATNISGTSAYSTIWNFTTAPNAPNVPVLSLPANNATNQPTSITFKWFKAIETLLDNKLIKNTIEEGPSPDVISKYWIEYGTDSTFATVTGRDSTLTDTTKAVTGLSTGTSYYWRVKAKNQTGWGSFSTRFKFTTLVPTLSLNLKAYLEGFWGGTTQVSDTVMVYLANSTSFAFVDTAKVVLSGTGTASMNFNRVTTGSYYIVVNHRNHLETWSKLPQSFVGGAPLSYDFTTAVTQAFGDNMKQVGSVWVLFGGDANRDGSVDGLDVTLLVPQFGSQGYLEADFDGDQDVTGLDVALFVPNFGMTKVVPTLVVVPVIKTKDFDYSKIDSRQIQKDTKKQNNSVQDKNKKKPETGKNNQ